MIEDFLPKNVRKHHLAIGAAGSSKKYLSKK